MRTFFPTLVAAALVTLGCDVISPLGSAGTQDASTSDAAIPDSGKPDAGDSGFSDGGQCDSSSCALGCCGAAGCVDFSAQTNSECGTGGQACQSCGGSACDLGVCSTGDGGNPDSGNPDGGSPDSGNPDSGNHDGGICGPGTCSGCCQGNSCILYSHETSSDCGNSGNACIACVDGGACLQDGGICI